MKTYLTANSVVLWLSAKDTTRWAQRWPCSQLEGVRLRAAFDSTGLYELAINGSSNTDVDANEFNAIASDFLARKLSVDHPCYLVCVGQFL